MKIAPSLCLLNENVTNITFPEDVSFMTGDEPETGSPHHLRRANELWKDLKHTKENEIGTELKGTGDEMSLPGDYLVL